jgi:hypothetical protein
MCRKLWFVIIVCLGCLSAAPASAQPPGPRHSDPSWQVYYWNNMSLSGGAVVESTHANIDWDWGSGSPHPAIQVDGFSARWTRYIDVAAGTYRFAATSDDGVRVYVDGTPIIDEWHDHPPRTYIVDVNLAAGHHWVVVEYYENLGEATIKVSWQSSPGPSGRWRGEYFANRWLGGSPALVREDAHVDFDWGPGSPGPGIPNDDFSVRWTRTVQLQPGDYRFRVTSDDGIRLYVDDRLVIDQWWDHPAQTFTAYLRLTAGKHMLVVEYYEHTQRATVHVSWEMVPPESWTGEYYDNPQLQGLPRLTRHDVELDFDWGYGSPAPGIPNNGFSVRWIRTVTLRQGLYRFTTTTDDGVRLWVNGHLLIDYWHDQPPTSHSATLYLPGSAAIAMEYYENGGVASAQLAWTRVGNDLPQPGEVVVDNGDPGFVKGGSEGAWHTAAGGQGGRLIWTWNNDRQRPRYNWVRWYPDLEPRRYEVFVYVPERHATTSKARYWISHSGGYKLRTVDQSGNGGRWVSLGTYRFRGNRSDYVSLADVTFEPYLSRLVAFDAVKWVHRP